MGRSGRHADEAFISATTNEPFSAHANSKWNLETVDPETELHGDGI